MGTYGLERIVHLWSVDRLTVEQAIGQMLQLIQEMDERIKELESRAEARRARRDEFAGPENSAS